MPEHEVYLEPFFGSGAILFNKPAARIETINDLDGNIINLFKVNKHQGFAMISGYNNDMYNAILQGWTTISKMATTEAAKEKCESLWLNPQIIERGYRQESLFETV